MLTYARSVSDSSLLSRVTILTMSLPDLCGNGNLELEEAERMVKEFKDVVDQCKKNYEENEETLSTLIIKEVEKQNNGEKKEEKTKNKTRLTSVEEHAAMKEMMDEFQKKYEDDLKIERAKIDEKLSALDLKIKEVEKQNNVKVKVEKKNKDKRQEKENCCMM